MSTFCIKQGDLSPAFQLTLKDSAGTAVNLTGSTVRLHLYTQDKATVVLDKSATLVDAVNGVVKYEWVDGDTDDAGWFWVEFEVTYADSTVETFPNSGYIGVVIEPQLA